MPSKNEGQGQVGGDERPEIRLEDADGTSLIRVAEAKSLDFRGAKAFAADSGMLRGIGNALEAALRATGNMAPTLLQGETYRLILSPELQKAHHLGQIEYVKTSGEKFRAILRTIDGKEIAGHAELERASFLSLTNVAAIGFQVASVATAQYYLHQINSELKNISEQVQQVQEYLEEQALAKFTVKLKQVVNHIQLSNRRALSENEKKEALEDARESLSVALESLRQSTRAIEKEAQKDIAPKTSAKDADERLNDVVQHCGKAFAAAQLALLSNALAIATGWAADRAKLESDIVINELSDLHRHLITLDQKFDAYQAGNIKRNQPIDMRLKKKPWLLAVPGIAAAPLTLPFIAAGAIGVGATATGITLINLKRRKAVRSHDELADRRESVYGELEAQIASLMGQATALTEEPAKKLATPTELLVHRGKDGELTLYQVEP